MQRVIQEVNGQLVVVVIDENDNNDLQKGGAGSGNFSHSGRTGIRGGSGGGGGGGGGGKGNVDVKSADDKTLYAELESLEHGLEDIEDSDDPRDQKEAEKASARIEAINNELAYRHLFGKPSGSKPKESKGDKDAWDFLHGKI